MKHIAFLLAIVTGPVWAHVHQVNFDAVCTSEDPVPGLVLLPFLFLVGVGVARAIVRHRKAFPCVRAGR